MPRSTVDRLFSAPDGSNYSFTWRRHNENSGGGQPVLLRPRCRRCAAGVAARAIEFGRRSRPWAPDGSVGQPRGVNGRSCAAERATQRELPARRCPTERVALCRYRLTLGAGLGAGSWFLMDLECRRAQLPRRAAPADTTTRSWFPPSRREMPGLPTSEQASHCDIAWVGPGMVAGVMRRLAAIAPLRGGRVATGAPC